MKIEKIIIANLKCEDCQTTIKKNLLKIDGVSSVKIDENKNLVVATCDDTIDRGKIITKLQVFGYPEIIKENRFLT